VPADVCAPADCVVTFNICERSRPISEYKTRIN
jgi:hypothetical protein